MRNSPVASAASARARDADRCPECSALQIYEGKLSAVTRQMTSRCQIESFAVDLGRDLNKVRRGENGASSACGGPCVGPVQASPVTSACTSDCLVEVRVMEWLVPLVGMIMVGLIAQAHAPPGHRPTRRSPRAWCCPNVPSSITLDLSDSRSQDRYP